MTQHNIPQDWNLKQYHWQNLIFHFTTFTCVLYGVKNTSQLIKIWSMVLKCGVVTSRKQYNTWQTPWKSVKDA